MDCRGIHKHAQHMSVAIDPGGNSVTWNQWYKLRSYLRTSLWITPFIAIPIALIAIRILRFCDVWLGWSFLNLTPPGALAMLQGVSTATLSFLVFTFGSLLVAIQVASAQLTPRIIATTLLRNPVVKYTVGIFIFTFLFTLSAQDRVELRVPQLVIFVAALLGVACFATFLFLIDYAARLLRPISILSRVAHDGLAVIESVYPELSRGLDEREGQAHKLSSPGRIIRHKGKSEIVLAVNIHFLAAEAKRANGVIEFVPRVGDFVAVDEPLFNLFGGARALADGSLRAAVAFGSERTIEQDPTFAFRIIVDIALRALSPAINDPTTAVLAIDQLQRMLRMAGSRHLRTDEILDESGQLRLIFRTPDWEDFVDLAFSEIRACGSSNLQIVRRLRAMIDNLVQTVPKHRHPALRHQLTMLDREIKNRFVLPDERALAQVADTQGLGGHAGRARRRSRAKD